MDNSSVKDRTIEFIKYKGLKMKEFEEKCGLSTGYVTSMRKGYGADKLANVLNAFPELNRNWLLYNEGKMLNNSKAELEQPNTANETAIDTLSDYETWLLPQKTHGGSLTSIPADSVFLQNCEKIVSPIKDVDFAIGIHGDSMAPEYPSGSRVLIKKINPDAFIDWGKAYVLDTCNGVILKEVLKCEREGFVTCHSINPDPKFADFDLSLNDVYGIYRVLMCLSAK